MNFIFFFLQCCNLIIALLLIFNQIKNFKQSSKKNTVKKVLIAISLNITNVLYILSSIYLENNITQDIILLKVYCFVLIISTIELIIYYLKIKILADYN